MKAGTEGLTGAARNLFRVAVARENQGAKLNVSSFAPSAMVGSLEANVQSCASARTHDSTSPALIPCQLRFVTTASCTAPSLPTNTLTVISPFKSGLYLRPS